MIGNVKTKKVLFQKVSRFTIIIASRSFKLDRELKRGYVGGVTVTCAL